jgi:AbiV family abortive infection protein
MANLLKPYKSKLSAAEIADGMNAALKNASRLTEDAEIMFNNGRYPSAASLAILAIEEAGKVPILREMSEAEDDDSLKKFWRAYRSHKSKNVSWIFPRLVQDGGRKLEDFLEIFDPQGEHPAILDSVKQIGFYTDCLGEKNWSIPAEVVDRKLAEGLVSIAKIFSKEKVHTEREILLWRKHMKGIPKGLDEPLKRALLSWHEEMKSEGLAKDGDIPFADFIGATEDYNK